MFSNDMDKAVDKGMDMVVGMDKAVDMDKDKAYCYNNYFCHQAKMGQ